MACRNRPVLRAGDPETIGIECFSVHFYVGRDFGRAVGRRRSCLTRLSSLFQLGLAKAWPLTAATSRVLFRFRLEPETWLHPVATRAQHPLVLTGALATPPRTKIPASWRPCKLTSLRLLSVRLMEKSCSISFVIASSLPLGILKGGLWPCPRQRLRQFAFPFTHLIKAIHSI